MLFFSQENLISRENMKKSNTHFLRVNDKGNPGMCKICTYHSKVEEYSL